MSSEYRALVEKVDAFTAATALRRKDDLTCSAGCASCCHAWLTVSTVEADEVRKGLAALTHDERAQIAARGGLELEREREGLEEPRCAMLDEAGRCAVYTSRPLVCRTQGHALRYPQGFIPVEAIARTTSNGAETWCPLNYHAREPNPEDVLDAERVDRILAVVAARYVAAKSIDERRVSLSALAAELSTEQEVGNDPTARAAQFEAPDR